MLHNLLTTLLFLEDRDLPLPITAAPLWSEAYLPVIAYFSIILVSAGDGGSSSARTKQFTWN